jgi:hypothetical protein
MSRMAETSSLDGEEPMRYRWRAEYTKMVRRYIEKHFGTAQGITQLFPYMKAEYVLKNDADVFDPRA